MPKNSSRRRRNYTLDLSHIQKRKFCDTRVFFAFEINCEIVACPANNKKQKLRCQVFVEVTHRYRASFFCPNLQLKSYRLGSSKTAQKEVKSKPIFLVLVTSNTLVIYRKNTSFISRCEIALNKNFPKLLHADKKGVGLSCFAFPEKMSVLPDKLLVFQHFVQEGNS